MSLPRAVLAVTLTRFPPALTSIPLTSRRFEPENGVPLGAVTTTVLIDGAFPRTVNVNLSLSLLETTRLI